MSLSAILHRDPGARQCPTESSSSSVWYVGLGRIFAKDDHHAEEITNLVREVFGKGNDFAKKVTYKTDGADPESLIRSFRNDYNPRIAVTVDMIATGTDVKPTTPLSITSLGVLICWEGAKV